MASEIGESSDYRRGTVFGLSIAEIFILLLFLLLVLLATFYRDITADKEQMSEKLIAAEKELLETKARLSSAEADLFNVMPLKEELSRVGIKTPEEIVTLVAAKNVAEVEVARLKNEVELANLVKEDDQEALEQALKEARSRVGEVEKQLEEAKQENARTQTELRLLKVKGENPPCWYRVVSDGKGGTRERPLYILNVGVFEDHLMLRPIDVPSGGAVDDGTRTYMAEASVLSLDTLPYEQPLSDLEFRRTLSHIYRSGQNSSIRTYPCISYVQVWDQTPTGAKERWKAALDEIQMMFGTYRVRDETW